MSAGKAFSGINPALSARRPPAPPGQMRGSGAAAVAACALLGSTAGLFIKFVDWDPVAIAGVRSLIGGVTILVWLRRPRFTWSAAQIAGALCYSATMITFVAANKLTTSANAILLQYSAPLYAAVLGWIFLREKTDALDWATIVVVIGAMVLFFLDRLTPGSIGGNILAILSGIFFAGSIVSFRAQKQGSSLESFLLSHALTFAISIPFLWSRSPGLAGWGGLAFLGVFQIGATSILLSYGTRHVPALQSLLICMLEPVFNPLWVFLALGEVPGVHAIIGGAVILAAVTARSVLRLRPG